MKHLFALLAALVLFAVAPLPQAHAGCTFDDTTFMHNAYTWFLDWQGGGISCAGTGYTGPASNCPATFYKATWQCPTVNPFWKLQEGFSCSRDGAGKLQSITVAVQWKPTGSYVFFDNYTCTCGLNAMYCGWQ